jgi:hypothetical protein
MLTECEEADGREDPVGRVEEEVDEEVGGVSSSQATLLVPLLMSPMRLGLRSRIFWIVMSESTAAVLAILTEPAVRVEACSKMFEDAVVIDGLGKGERLEDLYTSTMDFSAQHFENCEEWPHGLNRSLLTHQSNAVQSKVVPSNVVPLNVVPLNVTIKRDTIKRLDNDVQTPCAH